MSRSAAFLAAILSAAPYWTSSNYVSLVDQHRAVVEGIAVTVLVAVTAYFTIRYGWDVPEDIAK